MKKTKGILGLALVISCLWVVVVAAYARQVKEAGKGVGFLRPLATESCSSSSSSSSTSTSTSGEP